MKIKAFFKREGGQSFTELAVSLVFLLTLLSGVIDLGRALFTYTAMRDAVQEGASYMAMEPNDCEGTIHRIRDHTGGPIELSDPSILVDVRVDGFVCADSPTSKPPSDSVCPGDDIEVTITFPDFTIATPFIGAFLGSQSFPLEVKVFDSVLVDPDPDPSTGLSTCTP